MIARVHWPYVVLLAAMPFAVYANGYRHAYQLDDAYTITSNPSVRSLRAIPRYFTDPGTYTSLREQADYRPIVQLTYALDYRLGGYDMPWWHVTQIMLHLSVVLGVYALCLCVLALIGDVPTRAPPELVAFVAAAVVAVHPTSSGVVNYINDRSSLLTAALLVWALVQYARTVGTPRYVLPQYAAAALYALALFAKVEAVGALGAFWAFDLWQRSREHPDAALPSAMRASFDRRTLARLAPMLVITAVYFIIRARVMAPFPFADARRAPDIGVSTFFATQLTAWWYYLACWVAPVRLIADYVTYPVYRSWLDPVVLFAAGGWIATGTLLVAAWKRAPYFLVLAIAALALLSPTSSIAPLAEMVNERRPYLPIAVLSLAVMIPVGTRLLAWPRGRVRTALATSGAVVFLALCLLTWRRNDVFATPIRYWTDVIDKAPSSRAHLNLGVALMQNDDMPAALRELHSALELAPFWYYADINLGVAYQHVGQTDSARAHYDRAVQYDQYSGVALTWRGEFRLATHDYAGARDDFLASMPVGLQEYRNVKGLATAFAGLGDAEHSLAQTERLLSIDSASAVNDVPAMSLPFFENADLRHSGAWYYEALQLRLPHQAWIAEDISRLGGTTGDPDGPSIVLASSDTVSQDVLMARGIDLLYTQNSPMQAAAQFRMVLQRSARHYGATYQLAVALDRAGQSKEARAYWSKVLEMATSDADTRTADQARARLAR